MQLRCGRQCTEEDPARISLMRTSPAGADRHRQPRDHLAFDIQDPRFRSSHLCGPDLLPRVCLLRVRSGRVESRFTSCVGDDFVSFNGIFDRCIASRALNLNAQGRKVRNDFSLHDRHPLKIIGRRHSLVTDADVDP